MFLLIAIRSWFPPGVLSSNIMVSPPNPQDVARGAGKEVILGDQRIEELFEQIGVAWKEVSCGLEGGELWPGRRLSPGSCPIGR